MGCLCGPFRGYGCISAIQVIIDFGFIGSTVNKVLFFVDVGSSGALTKDLGHEEINIWYVKGAFKS